MAVSYMFVTWSLESVGKERKPMAVAQGSPQKH